VIIQFENIIPELKLNLSKFSCDHRHNGQQLEVKYLHNYYIIDRTEQTL